MSIKKLLVAHDLTRASEPALALSLRLARQLGATLVVLHVFPPEQERSNLFGIYSVEEMEQQTGFARREQAAASKILRDKLEQLNPPGGDAVVCEIILRHGKAVDVVNEVASSTGTQLIVVGTNSRRGLEQLVLGSVSANIIRTAPCPVVVARPADAND